MLRLDVVGLDLGDAVLSFDRLEDMIVGQMIAA